MTCYRLKQKLALAAALLVYMLCAHAVFNDTVAAESSAKSTQNKLLLLENVLKKSKRPREVYASGNDQAIKIMDEAQQHYESAKKWLEKGDYQKSDEEIQQSLQKISTSFRMVEDKESEAKLAREEYEQLHKRVKSFKDLYDQLPANKSKGLMDVGEVNSLISEAESLHQQNQSRQALPPLSKAADMLEQALSDARKDETVVYALDFATPEDEYQYELKRNVSYVELTDIILASESPEIKKKLPLIKMLIKKNEKLVSDAKSKFQAGDVKQAIELMEKGNKTLVQALRIGGMTL